MKILLLLVCLFHGLIHLMGFAKAFQFGTFSQLQKEITRPVGLLWLGATVLFLIAAFLIWKGEEIWSLFALCAIILSQLLIVFNWHDAKAGTIGNVLILVIAIPSLAAWRYEHQFHTEVEDTLGRQSKTETPIVTLEDLAPLPLPVQQYIIFSGAVNQPRVTNFTLEFSGQIRASEESPWMPFTTEQYNFIDRPTRLFFMKATMKGLPVSGYHAYRNGVAIMDIRLLSLFRVQYQSGPKMDIAETVTWLNDLCLFAPGALLDHRIQWQPIDDRSCDLVFTEGATQVSARLYFNERGELINFISPDRYFTAASGSMERVPFKTPASLYVDTLGHRTPTYGEAIWGLAKGDFCYGQFHLKSVRYNLK